MPIIKAKWRCTQFLTERFWPVVCLRISTNWLSHGLRFIKKICWLTGTWLGTVRHLFQSKDLINENCRLKCDHSIRC